MSRPLAAVPLTSTSRRGFLLSDYSHIPLSLDDAPAASYAISAWRGCSDARCLGSWGGLLTRVHGPQGSVGKAVKGCERSPVGVAARQV